MLLYFLISFDQIALKSLIIVFLCNFYSFHHVCNKSSIFQADETSLATDGFNLNLLSVLQQLCLKVKANKVRSSLNNRSPFLIERFNPWFYIVCTFHTCKKAKHTAVLNVGHQYNSCCKYTCYPQNGEVLPNGQIMNAVASKVENENLSNKFKAVMIMTPVSTPSPHLLNIFPF